MKLESSKVSTLPFDVVEKWRAAAVRPENGHKLEFPPKKEGTLRIAALMACPRVAWTDTWGAINESFMPLGIGVMKYTGAFWAQQLSQLMEDCVRYEMDFIITVDYDSIFTKQQVLQLIKLITENPEVDAIVPVQVRREHNTSMFSIRGEDGYLLSQVPFETFQQPLTKIATGHFGCTIIRVPSLEKLIKPWFLAIPDEHGEWGPGHIDDDIYFWLNAEVAGWEVRLANEIRIGHLQTLVTWPKPDFTPLFQYSNDFNEKGQPV